ncbi:MAG: NAD(P)H-quinone oxidoreductase subunit 3 [Anaerolineae bacterium]|nr:NAD(P)H-quinone oxidoreductase subunit 3 [Anaerolineae bacterium]
MLSDWLYVGIFLVIATFLPFVAITLAGILGPKKPNRLKSTIYECGIETVGETWVQFRAQYYIFALVFVVFDVETVLLYPWAVAYNQLGLFAVAEAVLFVLILFAALVYAWRKGALRWF